jgi:hypothetical protein
MTARPITMVASRTARSIRRRLAAPVVHEHRPPQRRPPERDYRADDARLDELRGELVHELDRLAAADEGCSAGFRRI